MINIISDDFSKSTKSLKINSSKKFKEVGANTISKYDALIIKIDNDEMYVLEKVTIISSSSIIDLIIEGSSQKVEAGKKGHKKTIKKIKKFFIFYNRQFQFGLDYSKLSLLLDSKQSLVKYKLLRKNKLSLIKEEEYV